MPSHGLHLSHQIFALHVLQLQFFPRLLQFHNDPFVLVLDFRDLALQFCIESGQERFLFVEGFVNLIDLLQGCQHCCVVVHQLSNLLLLRSNNKLKLVQFRILLADKPFQLALELGLHLAHLHILTVQIMIIASNESIFVLQFLSKLAQFAFL